MDHARPNPSCSDLDHGNTFDSAWTPLKCGEISGTKRGSSGDEGKLICTWSGG